MSYVSTGGAMLEMLEGKVCLPIAAILTKTTFLTVFILF
jgi:3-phosphoglycerate kinase